jgi:hypothetical protein
VTAPVESTAGVNVDTAAVVLNVWRDGATGGLQLSIDNEREDGSGHGYRIAGPKFNGSGENLLKHRLDQRDADEIRSYLDVAFPQALPAASATCAVTECAEAATHRIVLINRRGDENSHHVYCQPHANELFAHLTPTYLDGGPAARIDALADQTAVQS